MRDRPVSGLRLVIITPQFWPLVGGAENLWSDLAACLAERGCQVTILTARWQRDWPSEIRFHDVPVVRLSPPPDDTWQTLRYTRSLARWLRRHADCYDLVYVAGLRQEAYAALRAVRGRAPVALHVRRAGSRGDGPWHEQSACGQRIQRECRKSAAALIVPSPGVQQELQAAGYPPARIHYLPDGVALPPPRTAAVRTAARAALGGIHVALNIPHWAPLVLYTGRLHRQQGLRTLVAAWGPIAARWPNARLWLAGDGPSRDSLGRQIQDLNLSGRVLGVGVFDCVDELLAAADLFVLPAPEPGASRSLREAMAAGLPIVAADTADNRQWISNDCQGLLVPAEDAEALSAAMARVLDQPELAARLGTAARQRAAEFSLARMVDEHQVLFERLVRHNNAVTR